MAFPTSTFSIREYALKMREKDLSKSWPFGEEMAEAAMPLPPLTVTKFRWWSHELEILESKNIEMKKDKVKMKKVQGGFLRMKSRTTPKKRSIAEIFAVAPPVETMMISNDCAVEKVVGDKVVKATSLAKTLVSAIKTIKSKNKNNKIKDFDHEKHCKRGQRNRNNVSVRSKKPCYKRLSSSRKNEKLVKQSNVAAKQQRSMPHVKSILKHSVKVVSETNPSSTNLKCSDQVINNGSQKSDRHVSFSDKDDVLGPNTKAFSDTFEKNDEGPVEASEGSSDLGQSNKGVSSMEVSVNDNNVGGFSARHEVDSQFMKGKIDQLPNVIHDPVNAQSSMRPHPCSDNANHSAEELISVNRVLPRENNLHLFDHVYVDGPQKRPSVYSAVPAAVAVGEERQYEHVRTQHGLSFWPRAHSFYGNSVDDHLNNPVNGAAALNSSENAVGRFLNMAESSAKDTRCRFPNWEQSTVAYKEKDVNDGFFCLPLNSKGELIQLNSGLLDRFDQMNEASNIACSSRMPVYGLTVPRSSQDYFIDNEKPLVDTDLKGNQLTLFPLHSNMQENRNRYSSAGFDVDEPGTSLADIQLPNFERGIDSGTFFVSNSPNPSFNRCKHFGKLHNQNVSAEMYAENPTRQTMRLMGKDVAIGGNGKEVQEPEVINFWKNSTSIENCLTNPIQENPMRKRNFLQDRMFYPAGFHGNQMAQRNLLENAPQVRYPHLRLDRKNSIMYQRSDSVINLNERFNNIHVVSPSSTDQAFNMAPNFQAPFISGPERLRFGSQPSAFSSHHLCTNKYENSFELGFNHNLHPAKLGALNFPFLQPDDENHVQLPWFHRSYSRQWGEAPTANSERVNRNGYYSNPFISSDTDVFISPSPMHHPHEAAYPCHTTTSHLQMKNMCSSTPFFQPIPVAPRFQSPSTRMSTEDRLNFNILSVKDSALSKERPAADLFDSRKRQKISSLDMNNAGVVPRWTSGKFMDSMQSNPGRKAKIHANWDKAVNSAGNISNLTQIDECMARSGPIKLTAGAKHILKPSLSIDLDNTKPTYSTIPSAGLVHSVSLAESQKSTKVYSF